MTIQRTSGENSEAWFAKARELLPGGVSSPVRAFGAVLGSSNDSAAFFLVLSQLRLSRR